MISLEIQSRKCCSLYSRHLDDLYLVAPCLLVVAAQPLEVFVQEVSGGPERDQEPAQHHRNGPGQVHRL